MNIKNLILTVKKKINENLIIENIDIQDKTFLHKNHKSHEKNKFHLKLVIKSKTLKKMSKIESSRKIYSILKKELQDDIHSLQILIN